MPPLSREEKRVAVATFGVARDLVQELIVEVRKELLRHGIKVGYRGITLESLKKIQFVWKNHVDWHEEDRSDKMEKCWSRS